MKAEGKELWRYRWDFDNRLVSASTRKQTVRYKYDALGRRIQRFIVGGKENTKFIYHGADVIADDNSGTLTKYINGLRYFGFVISDCGLPHPTIANGVPARSIISSDTKSEIGNLKSQIG